MATKNELFIGVCGGSASGKTTICEDLANYFVSDLQIISQDSYYIDRSHLTEDEVKRVNFDHPESIDLNKLYSDVVALKKNKIASIPQYSFKTHSILKDEIDIKIKKVNIIEGLYVLKSEDLRNLFDLKVYVHADDDIRLVRRIKRDMEHRGRSLSSILNQYVSSVKPMNEQFVVQQKEYADSIIDTTESSEALIGVKSLVSDIKGLVF